MSGGESITNLSDAVAALGALPVPVGPEPQALVGPQMPPFPPAPESFEEKLRADVARLQGLLAEATREVHNTRRERDLMRERVSEPYGCKHCGEARRSHGRRYVINAGMHSWERPSDEQVKDRMLARRMARLPFPSAPELDRVHEELTGVSLSLWEEEQENARLRLALKSAQRGRLQARETVRQMVEALNCYDCPPPNESPLDTATRWRGYLDAAEVRVAELSQERHVTNEALSDAAEQLRVNRDRIAELEALTPAAIQTCRKCGAGYTYGQRCTTCEFKARMASELQARGLEGEHYATVHHSYLKGRDLDRPEAGGQR